MMSNKILKNINTEKGIALLWALITITVLLTIAGSMAGLVIKESQMSSGIDASVQAYAAAESGIEHGTFLLNDNSLTSGEQNTCPTGGTPCQIETNLIYNIDFSGSPGNWIISSTGKSGNTTRKIEKNLAVGSAQTAIFKLYNTAPPLSASSERRFHPLSYIYPSLNTIDTSTKSFIQQFNIKFDSLRWGDNVNNGDRADIGVSVGETDDPNNMVNVIFSDHAYYSGSEFCDSLKSKSNYTGITIQAGNKCNNYDLNPNDYLKAGEEYKVRIDYKKGSSVKVTLNKGPNGDLGCAAIVSTGLPVNFNPIFNRVSFLGERSMGYSSDYVDYGSATMKLGIQTDGTYEAGIPFMGFLIQ